MIKLENIYFSYGENTVLRDFSVNIKKGDKICLFGESGCGKTTILRLILGLEAPQGGNIIKLFDLKPAVVFQEDRLLQFKSVLENITLMGAEKSKALKCLESLGLIEQANDYPNELSGGMSRRVAIARALANEFDFLVLDEPFTGLDEENTGKIIKFINEILEDRPLILVTHNLKEAEALNCKIINLKTED